MSNTITIDQLSTSIIALENKRKEWEKGSFRISTMELYSVLSGILELYLQILGSRELIAALNIVLKEQKIMHNSTTSLAIKLMRLVFSTECTRNSAYATTIQEAANAGIDGLNLPAWINENRGIENIRKSKAGKPRLSVEELANEGAEICTNADAILKIETSIKELEPHSESTHTYSVGLFRQGKGKSTEIVFGTNKQTLVNKVLAEAGQTLASEIKAAETLKETQQKKQMLADTIKAAKASS